MSVREEMHHTCKCHIVEEMLYDPASGLSRREDGIYIWDGPGGRVDYYCWRCKGVLPNLWNARISDEERERLQQIIESIATSEDAIEQLGKPDWDLMQHSTRNMEYYSVSACANLEFYLSENYPPTAHIVLKFNEEDQLWFDRQNPPHYEDGTDNGNEPMEVIPFQVNWVKCPNCGWRFRLDYATHSGLWPVHARCGQRLKIKAT